MLSLGSVCRALALCTCVALSFGTSAAPAAPVKHGHAFLGPTLPSLRSLQATGFTEPLLVQLKRGSSERTVRASGARLISRRLDIWLLQPAQARTLVPALMRSGAVAGIERNRSFEPARRFSFSDPLWPMEWWRADVGAEKVTAPGPGVPITILDSGIDLTHPDFNGANVVPLNPQVLTDEGDEAHGTAVASVAAASANGAGMVGIYPGATIWTYDIRDFTIAQIIAGIEAALDRGPSVINMSWGGTFYDPLLEQEILGAFGSGSIVVAAAGNEFDAGNPTEFPASLNHVLTVAATDQKDEPTDFSNSNDAVDLAAPGENIVADVPLSDDPTGWALWDGTSFSAPIVAAATAWTWSVRRDLDQTQMFDLMRWSTRDIWKQDFDPDTGFGLLDVPAALSQDAPARDPQEPNEDIYMIKANGLFRDAVPSLTKAGQGKATITARLDYTEDPEDVYRVYVPAHRTVSIRIIPDDNVNLELWRPNTRTVFARDAEKQKYLIAGSFKAGKAFEVLKFKNTTKKAAVIYADVFLGEDAGSADYTLSVTTKK